MEIHEIKPKKRTLTPEEKIEALLKYGNKALKEEQFKKAEAYFRRALQISPFRKDIKELLAQSLDRAAVEMTPDEPDQPAPGVRLRVKHSSERAQPRISLRAGLWILAFGLACLTVLSCLLFFSDEIQTLLTRMSNLGKQFDPVQKNATMLYDQSQALAKQGRYDEAIATLSDALALNLPNKKFINDKLAEFYHEKGNQLYYNDSNYSEAQQMYQKATDLNSGVAVYFSDLGWAYYMVGKRNLNTGRPSERYFRGAISAFQRSLEIDSGLLLSYRGAALAYVSLKDISNAALMYQKIIEIAPGSDDAGTARRQLLSMGLKVPETSTEQE